MRRVLAVTASLLLLAPLGATPSVAKKTPYDGDGEHGASPSNTIQLSVGD